MKSCYWRTAFLLLCLVSVSNAGEKEKRLDVPGKGTYISIPGSFNLKEGMAIAAQHGGHLVVFNSMAEHKQVIDAFGMVIRWTGHYQLANGKEPGCGWVTVTGRRSAPLNQLFNSNGPDDGVRNKWGWNIVDGGIEVYYGPSSGKNEDGAVTWHDNGGKLEDVSVNHRCGLIVEIPR